MKLFTLIFLSLFYTAVFAGDIQVENFTGENPGNLKMYTYRPEKITRKTPLIVLMHGCTQTANEFANNTGWLKLAKENNFFLILPEQNSGNNSSVCFNWFEPEDTKKNSGEAASIMSMINHATKAYFSNKPKMYVAGFSAGGAMTTVMLTLYPELFEAGAIYAGLPFGCANSMQSAFMCMFGLAGDLSQEAWAKKIRDVNPDFTGVYPKVSIWHGTNDSVVKYKNAIELTKQWTGIHNLKFEPTEQFEEGNYQIDQFQHGNEVLVQTITIKNMDHRVPIDTKTQCGSLGQWEEDLGLCSANHILKFWELL